MNYVAMRQSAELASQAKSHPGGGFETGNRPEHGTTRAPNMRISWKNVRALFNVGFFLPSYKCVWYLEKIGGRIFDRDNSSTSGCKDIPSSDRPDSMLQSCFHVSSRNLHVKILVFNVSDHLRIQLIQPQFLSNI